MAKFNEDTLAGWAKPPSDSEEIKLTNAERMIREALKDDPILSKKTYEIFGQGSYVNDTNVRLNSDIDINVQLTSTVYADIPLGKTLQEYGYNPSDYSFNQFKSDVFNALSGYFGSTEVVNSNKCIKIKGNTYRVQADVVPTFRYDKYFESGAERKGSRFISNDQHVHTNFAIQHIENGKVKNGSTGKRFKRLCRIVKRIRYKMLEEKISVNSNISSFLIECLLYNVPDNIYNSNPTWEERLRQSIIYLYDQTKTFENIKGWTEVSGCLYLFNSSRKWSEQDVNQFMQALWTYLQF